MLQLATLANGMHQTATVPLPTLHTCRLPYQAREVGCSELYDMVTVTMDQQQKDAATALAATPVTTGRPDTASPPHASGSASPQDQPGYYKGMLTSGLRQDNGASSGDMLKRSLKLAGGAAALLALLLLAFLSSNGLV